MPDMLATASAWLDATLNASVSQTGTYRRNAASVELTATIGMTPIGTELSPGLLQTWQSRDLLVLADDLFFGATLVPVFAGNQFYPEVGDIWEQEYRGEVLRYEVQQAEDGRCWRWCDESTRESIRIHTKQITS